MEEGIIFMWLNFVGKDDFFMRDGLGKVLQFLGASLSGLSTRAQVP